MPASLQPPASSRCPGCGRDIVQPCRACQAQRVRDQVWSWPADFRLTLELEPEDLARYHFIRRLRLRFGAAHRHVDETRLMQIFGGRSGSRSVRA